MKLQKDVNFWTPCINKIHFMWLLITFKYFDRYVKYVNVVINHNYLLYISAKGFDNPTFKGVLHP